MNQFLPKIFVVFKEGYNKKLFFNDVSAGILVGIIALPLAIAFSVASGCTPQQGIITGIIAGFLISVFSGSRVQIGGPTGAFIILVSTVVHDHGAAGLAIATIMAGILLVIFGVLRLGNSIAYIPYPVTIGFTSAISVIIIAGQLQSAFGLKIGETQPEFTSKIESAITNFHSFSIYALSITVATILLISSIRKISVKIPGALIAIVIFSIIVKLFSLPVETLGDRFGMISGEIHAPNLSEFSLQDITNLFPSALAIALLGGIESLLSAVVADGMTGFRHRSNTELVAQGIANIITPLFGGIPATGAIARTATNIKNGGRTPVAGIIHALTLLVLFFFAGFMVCYIPFSVLAGILLIVAWNMGEWHLFKKVIINSKNDAVILISTFLLTLLLDLSIAIPAGIVLASLIFMKRMIDISKMEFLKRDEIEHPHMFDKNGVEYFTITGPFFFGVANRFNKNIRTVDSNCKKLVINMTEVPVVDITGLTALENVADTCKRNNIELVLEGLQEQPYSIISKSYTLSKLVDSSSTKNIKKNT